MGNSIDFIGGSCETAESIAFGIGAFFKNFNFGEDITGDPDTYDTALAAGKCLGATQGGGGFNAVPKITEVPIDNMSPLKIIDGWDVDMNANLIEVTPETLALALGTGIVTDHNEKYLMIKAKRSIDNSDYISNITYIGRNAASNEPMMIQIFNAVSIEGLKLTFAQGAAAVLPIKFTSQVDFCKNPQFRAYAPFAIYYPKKLNAVTVDELTDGDTTISGMGMPGAKIYISGGTIPANTETIVDTDKAWIVSIPKQESGVNITVRQEYQGRISPDTTVLVKMAVTD